MKIKFLGKFLVILLSSLGILSICLKFQNLRQKFVIVAKGNGGDAQGARLLYQYFLKKNKDVTLTSDIKINSEHNKVKYIIIGQAAILDFINQIETGKFTINEQRFYLYSHILSPDLIFFGKKYKDKIYIVTTESEKNINLKQLVDLNILALPLAIPTYLKPEAEKIYNLNKDSTIDVLSHDAVIHLGGLYKNSINQEILIQDLQFENSLLNLPIDKTRNVSIITHPRTFQDIAGNPNLIQKRMLSICGKREIGKCYFYVKQDLYDLILQYSQLFSQMNIKIAPPYYAILYSINELGLKSEQYVSVDQYNAFADIKSKVFGFLLNENDLNQKAYLQYYNEGEISENSILSRFLQVAQGVTQ